MSLHIKVLASLSLVTTLGLSLISSVAAVPLLAQDSSSSQTNDEWLNILERNRCVLRTNDNVFVRADGGVNYVTSNDSDYRDYFWTRLCIPGRVQRLSDNELLTTVRPLTTNKDLIIDSNRIRAVRQPTPGDYVVIVISKFGLVAENNVIDLRKVSEDDANALLAEIQRSHTVTQALPTPAPAPQPAPAPPPPPRPVPPPPAPQVQPTPNPSVPALW